MKKTMKVLALVLAFVLCMAATAGVTVALLQDDDYAVNTMVVGNVYIEQMEYERDENGKLVPFTQDKPWIPVTKLPDWNAAYQEWTEVGAPGSNQLFDDSVEGVLDKFVFVKNTGSTNAYYRTLVAIEEPSGLGGDYIHINMNGNERFDASNVLYTTIAGVRYCVFEVVYKEKLAPGEVSRPSLLQLYLDPNATNEDVALFGEKMDVLVLSQAVQASGFATAREGLNTAFGAATAANVKAWFESKMPTEEVTGTNKTALLAAIEAAEEGSIVKLTEDVVIDGYNANNKLVIDKAIVLDLNGKTITTECGWGGIDAKGGCSIQNGTIIHTGNTAAIKAFQVGSIENVVIKVTETAGKTKGGIVVQEGAGCYVGSIKNVTIIGATNGIETYRCGARDDLAIGYMENVTIDALDTGISLSAPIGKLVNCNIEGNNIGINAYLYGPYSVTAELVGTTVTGATAIYAHDEVGQTNPGSLTLTWDAASVINGAVTEEFEAEVAGRVSVN